MFSIFRVGEVTLEFKNFTASAVEANSPLLGWFRLDADLNEILATSQIQSWLEHLIGGFCFDDLSTIFWNS
ncbi:hypothetical protein E6C27_scaffold316G00830 [Cucumis melo var. makuwa]|uniref:Uncharacterized protein n=1 Tax=Cucumis melo var. makuwa TaxID=1194695 RepID=A0A5A7TQB6_CUCMM|nr:hypothetical protein E6C27_scaffold316G00830 [Cucumis melo var. makuwa]